MAEDGATSIYDFTANDIDGTPVNLGDLCRDRVCVIVNVATQWGLTKTNYAQLQALYRWITEPVIPTDIRGRDTYGMIYVGLV